MSEKRFVETISTGIVTDNVTGKEYRCEMRIDEDLLELLNELHEENEQLKKVIEENEKLKSFKSEVFELIDKKINKLKNTNEVSLIPRESVEILKELKKELEK